MVAGFFFEWLQVFLAWVSTFAAPKNGPGVLPSVFWGVHRYRGAPGAFLAGFGIILIGPGIVHRARPRGPCLILWGDAVGVRIVSRGFFLSGCGFFFEWLRVFF